MEAFVFSKTGIIEKKVIDKPICDFGSVILKPLYITPCSSDVHTIFSNSPKRPDMVLGHEGIAKVVEIGDSVKKIKLNDIVAVPACMPECGELGHGSAPFSGNILGRSMNGMWEEYFKVPNADNNLVVVPDDLKIENAILSGDMLATAYTGISKIMKDTNEDKSVLIFGSGAVGLLTAVLIRKFYKNKKILMVGTSNEINISLAKEFGVNTYVSYRDSRVCFGTGVKYFDGIYNRIHDERENSTKTKLVDLIFDYTNDAGFEEVIITAGDKDTIAIACDVARYGSGKIINLSYIEGDEVSLPLFSLGKGLAGKTFYFELCAGGADFLKKMLSIALDLQKNNIRIDKLFTHKLEGFDNIKTALNMMRERKSGTIKVLVDLNEKR